MFLGINMFWALLRLILVNESESGPKHIYAREHKLYCYIVLYTVALPAQQRCAQTISANVLKRILVPRAAILLASATDREL